jgi:hypothetical protein
MERHRTSLKSRILAPLLFGLAVTLCAAGSVHATGSGDSFSYHYKVKHVSVTGGFTYQGMGNGAQESGSIFQAMNEGLKTDVKANRGFLRYPPRHRFTPVGLINTQAFNRKYQKDAKGTYDRGLFQEPEVITCKTDEVLKASVGARLGYNKETKRVVVEWGLGFDPLDCHSTQGTGSGFIIEPADPYDGPCKGYLNERYPLQKFKQKEFTLPLSLTCSWNPKTPENSTSQAASQEARIAWNGQVVLKRVPEPDPR